MGVYFWNRVSLCSSSRPHVIFFSQPPKQLGLLCVAPSFDCPILDVQREKVRGKSLLPQVPALAFVRLTRSSLALAFLHTQTPCPQSLLGLSGDEGFLGRFSSSWILWAFSSDRIFSKSLAIFSGRSSVCCSFRLLQSRDKHYQALLQHLSLQTSNKRALSVTLSLLCYKQIRSLHTQHKDFLLSPTLLHFQSNHDFHNTKMDTGHLTWWDTVSHGSSKWWVAADTPCAEVYISNWAVLLPFRLRAWEPLPLYKASHQILSHLTKTVQW